VNHIGHFILTNELMDLLKQSGTKQCPARVVTVASSAAWLFAPPQGIRFDDLKGDQNYDPWERYGSAKLANILFSGELDRRLREEGANVLAVSLHPGSVASTGLGRHLDLASAQSMFSLLWKRRGGLYDVLFGNYKTIKQGICYSIGCRHEM
jgi:retinol dehydrogenase-12/retinol dehydrogenase-13